MKRSLLLLVLLIVLCSYSCNQDKREKTESKNYKAEKINDFKVIAYWTGSGKIEKEKINQLDQVIYSFLHLKGNRLFVEARDSIKLRYLNAQKEINPGLKVLISLGGWGGCETCSEVFETDSGRREFAQSVKDLMKVYDADGIDLDWEYPAIAGFEGHAYKPQDRENFTLLIKELRFQLGEEAIISFAAGGFRNYLLNSIEWEKLMPLVNNVNVMTYDMVGGGSSRTGHHTALFSTRDQPRSANATIKYLDSIGVSSEKIVLGAAFYARVWEKVKAENNGLYQSGVFKESVLYRDLDTYKNKLSNAKVFWDSEAQAPYIYSAENEVFVTYDDSLSVSLKTNYALENNLGGIMFWRLSGDKPAGLLDVIEREVMNFKD
ncbi:glycoside hydrolase family 18 protein [Pontixanthobacter gangjinensis]|uniref:chitinase n=1 Tax=Christiangramia aestuarii TaxID=1028746 RepID=A0A7K1LRG8_9FLAO|nr:glycosyl hydrolase family 18 protein [Christiangramia aestuarii]MUP43396.1 glycoside hydrolase [Christiangramia aestuarii]